MSLTSALAIVGAATGTISFGWRVWDRLAKPQLTLTVSPSNCAPGPDGVIETDATRTNVIVRIDVGNTGRAAAGRTVLEVWVPEHIDTSTLAWVEPGGHERHELGRPARDPHVKLDVDHGRMFATNRITQQLESVPRIGAVAYLRIPCPTEVRGTGTVPVKASARTDGSAAQVLDALVLRNTKDPF